MPENGGTGVAERDGLQLFESVDFFAKERNDDVIKVENGSGDTDVHSKRSGCSDSFDEHQTVFQCVVLTILVESGNSKMRRLEWLGERTANSDYLKRIQVY